MALFRRLFGGGDDARTSTVTPTPREMVTELVVAEAADDGEQIVEVEVVGESYRQDALAAIAGPKGFDGKEHFVGVTLRCEPTNEHDANAIRVECHGQLVGFVSRDHAVMISPALQQSCGGVIEARGLIVGGWDRGDGDVGSYGIRAWISQRDVDRIGVRPDDLDPSLRARWPEPPAVARGEARISPTAEDVDAGRGSGVTVTCEEHYQDTIAAAMPPGWNPDRTWPLLVDLGVVDANPHTKHRTPCIEVRIAGAPIGYFTPKMTDRHRPSIEAAAARAERVTALSTVSRREKGGTEIWRVRVAIV
jgi:hypothetical protein